MERKLKNLFLMFAWMTICFFCSVNAVSPAERLSALKVIQDSSNVDWMGYNDCSMDTNGEKNIGKLIRNGDVVFDVGAHVGEWSINMLKNKSNIKLHAFEPLPMLWDALQTNLKEFNVIFSPNALSDVNGESIFTYYAMHPGMSTLHQRPEVEKNLNMPPHFIHVKTQRLDDYCDENKITAIDFMKVDTEGNEWAVLLGANRILSSHAIGIIQFEYGGCYLDSKTTLKQIYDYLKRYGYTIYRVFPNGVIKIDKWRDELETYMYSNYLAVFTGKDKKEGL